MWHRVRSLPIALFAPILALGCGGSSSETPEPVRPDSYLLERVSAAPEPNSVNPSTTGPTVRPVAPRPTWKLVPPTVSAAPR